MQPINWREPVDLHQGGPIRDDGTFEIVRTATGTLSDMIDRVLLMPAVERNKHWIDGDSIGTIEASGILALGMRIDFPL